MTTTARGRSRRAGFLTLAGATAAAAVTTHLLGRATLPAVAASLALLLQSLLLAALGWGDRLWARGPLPLVGLGAATLLVGPVAWFFGPNAGFIGVVALGLLITGVLSGGSGSALPPGADLVVYAGVALSDLAVFLLVLTRRLPDLSLTPVLVGAHPSWHHALAHLFLQGSLLASVLTGRALGARYGDLATALERASHLRARRVALIDEARAEYRRTLAAARAGVLSTRRISGFQIGPLQTRDRRSEVYSAMDSDGGAVTVRAETRDSQLTIRSQVRSLRDHVSAGGPLSPERVVRLSVDLSEDLRGLHARGLTHLSICPERVALIQGRWRLAAGGESRGNYLAPEQLRGRAGQRADIHALAAVLAFAMTGRDPFRDAGAVFGARPKLSGPLREPILRGMCRDPEGRFADVGALRAALEGALEEARGDAARDAAEGTERARLTRSEPSEAPRADRPTAPQDRPRDAAYREKMRAFTWGVTAVCVAGAALLAVVAREPAPMQVAVLSMAGIVAAAWWHFFSTVRRGGIGYWPWIAAAALSVGPAYSVGLHSGVSAVLVLWLFSGGMFQAGGDGGQRAWALVAVLTAHSLTFAGILAGVIPDHGNVAVMQAGAPPLQALLLHAMLMATYTLAFVAGQRIDRRQHAVSRRAEAAAQDAAKRQVELESARDELDLALANAGGIFTGSTIGGYTVHDLLGRGGMGEVYAAHEDKTGRAVALKLVRADRVSHASALALFRREATAMARVKSLYVAGILAFGDGRKGLPFLAMERVDGRSLAEILRERGNLAPPAARLMIRQLSLGLGDVHRSNVVHCDVKPANVLLADSGRWKLVDFGVARAMGVDDELGCAGTPAYMAPEQCRTGGNVDARADLYALCLVAYRALVGRPAFTTSDPAEVPALARAGPPDPTAEVGAQLAWALRAGLAEDKELRYQTAAQLREVFEDAFSGRLPDNVRGRARQLGWARAAAQEL